MLLFNYTFFLSSTNMADTLVGAMDSFWFYQIQIVFIQDPILSHSKPNFISQSPLQPQQLSLDSSPITCPQGDGKNEEITKQPSPPLKERSSRHGLTKSKTRSLSQSPPTPKKDSKKLFYSSSMGALPKNINLKSFCDLELEEVKGFMDLGFIFKKEQINARIMRVVPGLQRIGGHQNTSKIDEFDTSSTENDDFDDEHEEKIMMRPYLSEAWLIKRPNSPLLNLRVPKVQASHDMKKHLRSWARIVAYEIQQES